MPLADLYRELRVPQFNETWGWSGRNEAANTVVFQIDATDLRDATASEKRNAIAKVHEFIKRGRDVQQRSSQETSGPARGLPTVWKLLLEDIAFAHAHDSCVRAIVVDDEGGHKILPNLGRVVEFDEDVGTYKIVFFELDEDSPFKGGIF